MGEEADMAETTQVGDNSTRKRGCKCDDKYLVFGLLYWSLKLCFMMSCTKTYLKMSLVRILTSFPSCIVHSTR